MTRRFASAVETVPEPCQIFGTPLRPFCLGHHLLFKRLALPFADNPLAEASVDDFWRAVCICGGVSYEESLGALLNGDWAGVFERWLARVNRLQRRPLFAKKNEWQVRIANEYDRAREIFAAYLLEGYKNPPIWNHHAPDGISLSAPWETMLKCRLVEAGFSDVFNGYLPMSFYDYHTVMELRQAENCVDSKKWKKVFFTQADAAELGDKP